MKNLKVLAASLLLCSAITSRADGYRRVEIQEFNGNITSVDLSDNLTTEFSDGMVRFVDGDLMFEFDRESVKSFNFGEVSTGIQNADAEGNAPSIEQGKMSFSNLPVGSRVMVVSLSGNVVRDIKAEGSYSISLNTLPEGVYVVKVNGVSYKITVK